MSSKLIHFNINFLNGCIFSTMYPFCSFLLLFINKVTMNAFLLHKISYSDSDVYSEILSNGDIFWGVGSTQEGQSR